VRPGRGTLRRAFQAIVVGRVSLARWRSLTGNRHHHHHHHHRLIINIIIITTVIILLLLLLLLSIISIIISIMDIHHLLSSV
jgi:hypothetical protein